MKNYFVLLCFVVSCTPSVKNDSRNIENERVIRHFMSSELTVTDSLNTRQGQNIKANNGTIYIDLTYLKKGFRGNNDSVYLTVRDRQDNILDIPPPLLDSLKTFALRKYIY